MATTESTYCFTALAEGYLISELPSTIRIVLLFESDSLALMRFDKEAVSTLLNFESTRFEKYVVSTSSFRFA